MHRREMLRRILEASGALWLSSQLDLSHFSYGASLDLNEDTTRPLYGGWVADSHASSNFIRTQARPFLSQQNNAIKGTGQGRIVLLYKFFEEVTKSPLISHSQQIGDCTGHAFGLGIDVLTAVRIAMHNLPERWVTKCATEIIYAGARVEAGRRVIKGDGASGISAAEFIRNWGVLLRQPYLNGKYDYTTYSGKKARILGKEGVPDDLEPLCREHPVKTCSIVRTWEECRDAVANGYPVALCSNIGYCIRHRRKRDSEGFLHRSRRPWFHAMIILGVDDSSSRPGALIQNSWGKNWIGGPIRYEQPKGSFWAEPEDVERALKQGDSLALSGYVGYPRVEIPDYTIW